MNLHKKNTSNERDEINANNKKLLNDLKPLLLKIENQLKLIYEGEPILRELYSINLDKDTIWSALFDELTFKQIMDIDDNLLFELVHNFAKERREAWLKPLNKKIGNKEKKSLKEIALIHIYQNKQITRANGNDIALAEGHTSGDSLYNDYIHYLSKSNRTNPEDSNRKTNNKIKLLERVILYLHKDMIAQKKAEEELKLLKSYVI